MTVGQRVLLVEKGSRESSEEHRVRFAPLERLVDTEPTVLACAERGASSVLADLIPSSDGGILVLSSTESATLCAFVAREDGTISPMRSAGPR